jgi:hypothetical protein
MADFEIITEGTLGSASHTIDLTSIPQTYKHLQIQFTARCSVFRSYPDGGEIQCNGVTSNSYGVIGAVMSTAGSSSSMLDLDLGSRSQVDSAIYIVNGAMAANVYAINKILIPDYAGTTNVSKMLLCETTAGGYTTNYKVGFAAGSFASGAAGITQVTLKSESASNQFAAGCSYWLAGWK